MDPLYSEACLVPACIPSIDSRLKNPKSSQAWGPRHRQRLLHRRHETNNSLAPKTTMYVPTSHALSQDSTVLHMSSRLSRTPTIGLRGKQYYARWKGPAKQIFMTSDSYIYGDYYEGPYIEHDCGGDPELCRLIGRCPEFPVWSDVERAELRDLFSPFNTKGEGWEATFQPKSLAIKQYTSAGDFLKVTNERSWTYLLETWLKHHHSVEWEANCRCTHLLLEADGEQISVLAEDCWESDAANILFQNWEPFSRWRTTVDDWFEMRGSGLWVSEHFDEIVEKQWYLDLPACWTPISFFKDFRMGRFGGGSRKDWKLLQCLPLQYEDLMTDEDSLEGDDNQEQLHETRQAPRFQSASYAFAKNIRAERSIIQSIKHDGTYKSKSCRKANRFQKRRNEVRLDAQEAWDEFQQQFGIESLESASRNIVSGSDISRHNDCYYAWGVGREPDPSQPNRLCPETKEPQGSILALSTPSSQAFLSEYMPAEVFAASETHRSNQTYIYRSLEWPTLASWSGSPDIVADTKTSNEKVIGSDAGIFYMNFGGLEPVLESPAAPMAEEYLGISTHPGERPIISKRAQKRHEAALRHGLTEYTRFPKSDEEERRKRETKTKRQRRQRQHRAANKASTKAGSTAQIMSIDTTISRR